MQVNREHVVGILAGPLWPGSVPGCQTTVMSLLASSQVRALLTDAAGRAGR